MSSARCITSKEAKLNRIGCILPFCFSIDDNVNISSPRYNSIYKKMHKQFAIRPLDFNLGICRRRVRNRLETLLAICYPIIVSNLRVTLIDPIINFGGTRHWAPKKCSGHDSAIIFYQILVKVGGNQDKHNISDEFESRPVPATKLKLLVLELQQFSHRLCRVWFPAWSVYSLRNPPWAPKTFPIG